MRFIEIIVCPDSKFFQSISFVCCYYDSIENDLFMEFKLNIFVCLSLNFTKCKEGPFSLRENNWLTIYLFAYDCTKTSLTSVLILSSTVMFLKLVVTRPFKSNPVNSLYSPNPLTVIQFWAFKMNSIKQYLIFFGRWSHSL